MTTQLWQQYYQKMAKSPHHSMTETAVNLHSGKSKVAIDCGCGTGRNLLFLHAQGYQVHGFDINENAIAHCHQDISEFSPHALESIQLSICSFEQFSYPEAGVIIANNSLYFAEPSVFRQTWQNLTTALEVGGIFAGDFMGINDDWLMNSRHTITAYSKEQVEQLFTHFDIIEFNERDELGQTALGAQKHWHTFSVIARKK